MESSTNAGSRFATAAPGKHRVHSGIELIVHLDIRPISVNYENLIVALQDGYVAGYSISGSARVCDVRKALYSARNYAQVPPVALLCSTRKELNACTSDALRAEQSAVVHRITEKVKTRLQTAGFELLLFRLTQLTIGTLRTPDPQPKPDLPSPRN